MNISKFKTNQTKELEGVWIDGPEGLQLRIARNNNPALRKFLIKHGKQRDDLTEALRKGVARYVLLGWKNLQDEEGKDVVYSSETAEQLFKDFPDFFDMVLAYSNDVDYFKDFEGN